MKQISLFLVAFVLSAFLLIGLFSATVLTPTVQFAGFSISPNDSVASSGIASLNNNAGGDSVENADYTSAPYDLLLIAGVDAPRRQTPPPTRTRTPVPRTATPSRTSTPVPPTATLTRTSTPVPPTATPTQARTLIFSDEFNGTTLDAARWLPCHWWATNYCTSQPMNELELYMAQNVLVGNGMLTLRGSKLSKPIEYCDRDCRNYTFASGLVQSGGGLWPTRPAGFTFTYGYVEVRAKIPAGKGLWPSIWLWPANYKDPPEIDIMEIIGDAPNKIHMTYHGADHAEFQGTWVGPDFSQDFHTYAIDWLPNALVWYVDGVERYRWTGATPNQAMYPILNLAIGGNWPGAPDASTVFPADFVVDYIRVYKH